MNNTTDIALSIARQKFRAFLQLSHDPAVARLLDDVATTIAEALTPIETDIATSPELTPYDTGARCEGKPWIPYGTEVTGVTPEENFGRVDFDDECGETVVVIHVDGVPDDGAKGPYVVHVDSQVEDGELVVVRDDTSREHDPLVAALAHVLVERDQAEAARRLLTGDNNLLWSRRLGPLLDALQEDTPSAEECDECNQRATQSWPKLTPPVQLCDGCLHDARRSGWEPGA